VRVPLKAQGLHPAGCAAFDLHRALWNAKRFRNQADERIIGLAVLRGRAHPDSDNRPAAGKALDTADLVARALGRQADSEQDAVAAQAPRNIAQERLKTRTGKYIPQLRAQEKRSRAAR
jgi:hypothetical protein